MNEVSRFYYEDFYHQVDFSIEVLSYNWEIQHGAVNTHSCTYILDVFIS